MHSLVKNQLLAFVCFLPFSLESEMFPLFFVAFSVRLE